MSVHPFAGLNPKPSHWGYNWKPSETSTAACEKPKQPQPPQQPVQASPEILVSQYANLPAALLSSLKRDKKPFTYTPGGVDLGEVLNARLQKRAERKKRYSEERNNNKQVMVLPTYNSPLEMYSTENALQMLEAQAGLVAEDKSLSSSPSRSATLPRNHTFKFDDDGKGVTQSKAFRVLQIITDTEEENPKDRSSGHGLEEETRWRGIRERGEIPSRFFHTLQKITGTDGEEEPPTRMLQPQTGPAHFQVFEPTAAPPPAAAPPPSTGLKRPAAFLPIKTTPGQGFRSVPPPNGPLRHPAVGTDF